jgi:hypothetical protein
MRGRHSNRQEERAFSNSSTKRLSGFAMDMTISEGVFQAGTVGMGGRGAPMRGAWAAEPLREEVKSMQVLCKASSSASDVVCGVCGQGFLVYWSRSSAEERAVSGAEIQQTLREQHSCSDAPNVHPREGFPLPAWDGDLKFSAAALLGGAPRWVVR